MRLKFLKSKFNSNILTLVIGRGFGNILFILITPILTRLYSPEDFGFMELYLIILSFLLIFSTAKYENSLYLPKYKKGIARVFDLASKLSVLFSIFLLIFIIIFGQYLWDYFDIKQSVIWLYLLPLALLISSQYNVISQLAIRSEEFKKLSLSQVLESIATGVVAICLGYFMLSFGLLVSFFFGYIVALVALNKLREIIYNKYDFSNKSRIVVAKKYVKFPINMIPSGLLNLLSRNVITFLLTIKFGILYVGYYFMIKKTLTSPSIFIGQSFGDVFKQQAADDIRMYGTCRPLFRRSVLKLTVISIIPFLIMMIYSPEIFEIILGAKWKTAGEMAQILTPMFFIRFITMPVSSIIILRDKSEIDLYWQLTFFVLSASAFFFMETIEEMLTYLTLTISFMYIISIIINYYLAKLKN